MISTTIWFIHVQILNVMLISSKKNDTFIVILTSITRNNYWSREIKETSRLIIFKFKLIIGGCGLTEGSPFLGIKTIKINQRINHNKVTEKLAHRYKSIFMTFSPSILWIGAVFVRIEEIGNGKQSNQHRNKVAKNVRQLTLRMGNLLMFRVPVTVVALIWWWLSS